MSKTQRRWSKTSYKVIYLLWSRQAGALLRPGPATKTEARKNSERGKFLVCSFSANQRPLFDYTDQSEAGIRPACLR